MIEARQQRTRVIVNGDDISTHVMKVNLPRFPEDIELVEVTMLVHELEIDPDGTLNIRIDTNR